MTRRYPLADMDTLLRVLTIICCAIPIVFAVAALRAPDPPRTLLLAVGAFMLVLYLFVYLWMRPLAFLVTPDELSIVWPLRRRSIAVSAITSARVLDREQLRTELGRIVRIGAGGLGGGFGLARTQRGLVELWVSRTDRMVFVECHGRRSLLLTPAEPEQFVRELGTLRTDPP